MRPYPVMLNLENKRAIVIGGGRVALRKTLGLLESGAKVAVISPKLVREMVQLKDESRVDWVESPFNDEALDQFPDAVLIFGTTDNRETNLEIYEAANKRKVPCNIADVPDLCSFIVPAVISQGDLIISVSTGGSSPALARRIREELEKQFGPEYGRMTRLMGELRKHVLNVGTDSDKNRKLFSELVDSELLAALRESDTKRALKILKEILPKDIDIDGAIAENRL
ncbi:MAG: bifunctional precorrin-2 dehydrogenase/sirohydrochlorin ferrochelatase [Deltaproteobacteria bacterium]|nr:bifunctional precorrin-2 dehydrogenase/sirohydrochlorin ferrochelatase [Deltaproteobacteria bacterium]